MNKFHDNASRAANLLKSLGNDRRLMILCQLVTGEKSVTQLEEVMGLRQSALSQHLARLRKDDLVKARREAKNVYYSLADEKAIAVLETLAGLYRADCPTCAPAERETAVETQEVRAEAG